MTLSIANDHIARTGLPYPTIPNYGRMSLSGLGALGAPCADSGTCGENPCTWWDNVWISDACRNFCKCSEPASWGAVGADVALGNELVSAAGVVGKAIGSAVGGTAQGIGSQLDISGYILLGIGAFVLILAMKA